LNVLTAVLLFHFQQRRQVEVGHGAIGAEKHNHDGRVVLERVQRPPVAAQVAQSADIRELVAEGGHLFAGRYKSLLIDGATPGYLRTVCDYVHLNPVRARLVGRRERLQKYRWSSYPSYLRSRKKRESWLRCDRLFGEHGLTKESRRSRLEFARRMEQRCVEPNDPNAEQIRRGWSFGAEDFIARLLDRLPGSVTEHHHGRERNQTDEQRAEAMIAARLKKLGWAKSELAARRKSDPYKVALAREVRSQTTMSLKWIAQRLEMGSWTHVSNLLRQ